MKFFLFALFFNLSLQAYAETTTIILNALPGHTENGKIVVTSNQQPHKFEWDLKGLKPTVHFYHVHIYEKGDCSNYSAQLTPMLIDKDKHVSMASGGDLVGPNYIGRTDYNVETSQTGLHSWAYSQTFMFTVTKKIFVLVEALDLDKKQLGAAVACGVAP